LAIDDETLIAKSTVVNAILCAMVEPPRRVLFMTVRSPGFDLDNYLPYLINRVGSIMALRFGEDVLARFDLSIAMWRVLAALASHGPQRHTDLAGLTSIEVSTLSRIVTRLVRTGLVGRTPSPTSGREITLALSERGRGLVDRLIPLGQHYEEVASAGLSKQEQAVLRRALRRMYSNLVMAEPMKVTETAGKPAARLNAPPVS
jgi:MarR family transcriptional regulator, organic hydroperoxide resistance regulator